MSYLDVPRIHIGGRFFTDPSTVNNDPHHYKPDVTRPSPWQEPKGKHEFKLVGCTVRSVVDASGNMADNDPLVGAAVASRDESPWAAKMADLDVYQQSVSTIFGLQLSIALGKARLVADADPATLNGVAFNVVLPKRGWGPDGDYGQGSYGGDSNARGYFQTLLRVDEDKWPDADASPALAALRRAASPPVDGKVVLSFKFVLDGFINNPVDPNYNLGRLIGTIGPYKAPEPETSPGARWLEAATPPDQLAGQKPPVVLPWYTPAFYRAPFKLDEERKRLVIDLSNSIANVEIGDTPVDTGTFTASVSGGADLGQFQFSGFVYDTRAGIVELPLTDDQVSALRSAPLTLRTSRTDIGKPEIFNERADGYNYEAVDRVLRVQGVPGTTATARVFITRWGRPLISTQLVLAIVPVKGGIPNATVPPDNPGNSPGSEDDITGSIEPTDQDGFATVSIRIVKDPGMRTPELDGQLYFVYPYDPAVLGCNPAQHPESCAGTQETLISVLAWSASPVIANPTWQDVVAYLAPYMKLFPSMKEVINLTDETTFRIYAANPPFGVPDPVNPGKLKPSGAYKHYVDGKLEDIPADYLILNRIKGGVIPFYLTRDWQSDPRFMPLTRDLSLNRIRTILNYIQNSYFPTAPQTNSAP